MTMAAPSTLEANHFSPVIATRPSPRSRAEQWTVRPRSDPPSRSVRNIDPSTAESASGERSPASSDARTSPGA
jgi:hypothetical protein